MKRWINKSDLRKLRPARPGEMVEPGQFAKEGDTIIGGIGSFSQEYILTPSDLEDYIEVDVPEQDTEEDSK